MLNRIRCKVVKAFKRLIALHTTLGQILALTLDYVACVQSNRFDSGGSYI